MRPHDLDPLSLLFGLTYALLGLGFVAGGTAVPWDWVLPLLGLALGAALLASALKRGGRRRGRDR